MWMHALCSHSHATEVLFKSELKHGENLRIAVEVDDKTFRFETVFYGRTHELLTLDGRVCGRGLLLICSLIGFRLN